MTVLRMQPASVAAAALVTNGAADERNFLNITSQSAPKPVVVERALFLLLHLLSSCHLFSSAQCPFLFLL